MFKPVALAALDGDGDAVDALERDRRIITAEGLDGASFGRYHNQVGSADFGVALKTQLEDASRRVVLATGFERPAGECGQARSCEETNKVWAQAKAVAAGIVVMHAPTILRLFLP